MSRILITGATGKVGSNFVCRILNEPAHESTMVRALCHNRQLEPQARLEVVAGSITDRAVVRQAMLIRCRLQSNRSIVPIPAATRSQKCWKK